jgi:hypothetical protein
MMNKNACLLVAMLAGAVAAAGCGNESAASPGQKAAARTVVPAKVAAEATTQTEAQPIVAAPAPVEAAPSTAPSTASPKPAGQRPPADRGPSRPGDAEKISFDDLNLGMREDMVYRPFLLTDRVKELDGKRLSIIGYMHGGVESRKNVKEFVLLKNTECKFGPGGQADHLAQVYLDTDATTAFTDKPVKVEATLKVLPYEGSDGNTWAIYRLEGAKIVR